MSNRAPVALQVAALVVGLEAAAMLFIAIGDLTGLVAGRIAVGIAIGLLLLALAGGLGYCSWGLFRSQSAVRSPVVVAQFIALGLAWSLRTPDAQTGDNRFVGVVIATAALIVLASLATPASRRALADPGHEDLSGSES